MLKGVQNKLKNKNTEEYILRMSNKKKKIKVAMRWISTGKRKKKAAKNQLEEDCVVRNERDESYSYD